MNGIRFDADTTMYVDHDIKAEIFVLSPVYLTHHSLMLTFKDMDRFGKKWRLKKIFGFKRYAKQYARRGNFVDTTPAPEVEHTHEHDIAAFPEPPNDAPWGKTLNEFKYNWMSLAGFYRPQSVIPMMDGI